MTHALLGRAALLIPLVILAGCIDDGGGALSSAVRVYDNTGTAAMPGGGTTTTTYRETQQLFAESRRGGGLVIDLVGTTDRSADDRTEARLAVEPDGSVFLLQFGAEDAMGGFTCEGSMPSYLAPGRDSAPAAFACDIAGRFTFSFAGTATASAPAPYEFEGTTYMARTITIEGSLGPTGGPLPTAFRTVAAPGIGTLEIDGSFADVIFGALGGPVGSETRSVLIAMDNPSLFTP